ncbi:predicted protein [Histoplasma capsulatum var. duboisii H88]|uniref:Predicted protein n=1 Tax=Ajellomyces capsulatus (strain H88) TaxID=544711 RepID=F0UM84_AJEC8|nr:predicted protein [Histoplasma capsulatum var. duboisii H88]
MARCSDAAAEELVELRIVVEEERRRESVVGGRGQWMGDWGNPIDRNGLRGNWQIRWARQTKARTGDGAQGRGTGFLGLAAGLGSPACPAIYDAYDYSFILDKTTWDGTHPSLGRWKTLPTSHHHQSLNPGVYI